MMTDSDKSMEDEDFEKNHETYCRGAMLFCQGNYSQAKHEFKAALTHWPEDPEAWMALGNCFDELKKPHKAEECFRKALEYCSEERKSDIYFNLGNSLLDQLLYEEAVECYREVSAQHSTYAVAILNMKRAQNGRP